MKKTYKSSLITRTIGAGGYAPVTAIFASTVGVPRDLSDSIHWTEILNQINFKINM